MVILPAAVRARAAAPVASTERFRRRLELLAPPRSTGGRWVIIPGSFDDLVRAAQRRRQRRRRRILLALLIASVGSLSAAVSIGGATWTIALGVTASLIVYVLLLLALRRRAARRAAQTRSRAPTCPTAAGRGRRPLTTRPLS